MMKKKNCLIIIAAACLLCGCGDKAGSSEGESSSETITTTTVTQESSALESDVPEQTTTEATESQPEESTTTTQADEPEVTTTTENTETPGENLSEVVIGENSAEFKRFDLKLEFPEGWRLEQAENMQSGVLGEGDNTQLGVTLGIETAVYDGEISVDDYIANLEKAYNDIIAGGDEGDPMAMHNMTFETADTEKDGVKGKKHLTSYEQRGLGKICLYEFIYKNEQGNELLYFTYTFSGDNEQEIMGSIDEIME